MQADYVYRGDMTEQRLFHELSLCPFWKDLRSLTRIGLGRDLNAGLSVALLTIPQAMAYALVAGLPLTCGLFAGVFATIMAALFGSSRHVVVGPTNAIAILVQAGTSEIIYTFYRGVTGAERDVIAVQIVTQLVLLVGVFQLLGALFRLGRLSQFVSQTVIIAYMTGTALAVVVNQSFIFLGLGLPEGVLSLFQKAHYLLLHIDGIHVPTLAIGFVSLVSLLLFRRFKMKIPSAALMLLLAAIAVYAFGLSPYPDKELLDPFAEGYVQPVQLVASTGTVHGIIPRLALPYFDLAILSKLVPLAFAIALLGMLETSSVAKSLASKSGQMLSTNQEILGLGFGNICSAFFGAMPSAGSPSRSALNYASKADSRFAALSSGIFVGLIVFGMGYYISFIPLAALAALLLVTSVSLVNIPQIMTCVKATGSDAFVFAITLASCFFFSVDTAFYIGIVLSIIFYLNRAAVPLLRELEPVDMPVSGATVRVIDVHGELFFGAADLFQATLRTIANDEGKVKVIVLRLKHARDLDATACLALRHLHGYLEGRGVSLLLCSVPRAAWLVLKNSGVADEIGMDKIYTLIGKPSRVCEAEALHRARKLCGENLPNADELAQGTGSHLVSKLSSFTKVR